jgi:hypothetical protein
MQHAATTPYELSDKRYFVWIRSSVWSLYIRILGTMRSGYRILAKLLGRKSSSSCFRDWIYYVSNLCYHSRTKSSRHVCDETNSAAQLHYLNGSKNANRKKTKKGQIKTNLAVGKRIEQAKKVGTVIYLFQYDMPGLWRDTAPLIRELRSFPGWAQCFNTTWLIATHENIETVEQRLNRHIQQPEDKELLLPIGQYRGRLPQEIWDWINAVRNAGY